MLIGGSTRTPYVKKILREFLPSSKFFDEISPDEGVAYGAVLMAAQLTDQLTEEVIGAPDEECSSEEEPVR